MYAFIALLLNAHAPPHKHTYAICSMTAHRHTRAPSLSATAHHRLNPKQARARNDFVLHPLLFRVR